MSWTLHPVGRYIKPHSRIDAGLIHIAWALLQRCSVVRTKQVLQERIVFNNMILIKNLTITFLNDRKLLTIDYKMNL